MPSGKGYMNESAFRKTFKDLPTIETPRLILKKIAPENAEDMYEYSKEYEVSKYLLWSPHLNIDESRGYIEYLQRQYKRGAFADWGLNLKETGKFIGTCGFTSFNFACDMGEIGYVLSPFYRKQGYMHEAVGAILKVAFLTLDLSSVIIRVMDGNNESIAVGRKYGFIFYKTDFKGEIVKGEPKTIHTFILHKDTYLKGICT